MGAMALPQKLKVTAKNAAITRRIGVRINGRDQQDRVHEYDVAAGTALVDTLTNGLQIVRGTIEPFWR